MRIVVRGKAAVALTIFRGLVSLALGILTLLSGLKTMTLWVVLVGIVFLACSVVFFRIVKRMTGN